jgi:YD repeat-containing protein
VNGSAYSFAYDTMGRMNTMTDTQNSLTLVSGMTYGVAKEVQQMTSGYTTGVNTETRHYNGMFQLTQLQVGSSALNIQYNYSATQNNGKITSQTDVISGAQLAYTYDALNRLASAQTTQTGGTQWGQSYTYDGFGNLTSGHPRAYRAGGAPGRAMPLHRTDGPLRPPYAAGNAIDAEAHLVTILVSGRWPAQTLRPTVYR